jgi:hypothetical protein
MELTSWRKSISVGLCMKKFASRLLFLSISLLSGSLAHADIALYPGESITIRGEEVSCASTPAPSPTRCFCEDNGCSIAYTSKGRVVLNMVTRMPNGRSPRTQCIEYDTEAMCNQAASACH